MIGFGSDGACLFGPFHGGVKFLIFGTASGERIETSPVFKLGQFARLCGELDGSLWIANFHVGAGCSAGCERGVSADAFLRQ